jgi:hypothetical protein
LASHPAEAKTIVALATAAVFLAADGVADLSRSFTGATPDMACGLIDFAPCTHIGVTGRTAGDFLRHALDLLSDALYLLFRCLSAERTHPNALLHLLGKQETFRRSNANPMHFRLTRKT